ncbi:MAG: transcriptional regulator [Alphaproteobacteria bacterium]|nr:transcriptional regulator [Alphaproteobacteria bacterium]
MSKAGERLLRSARQAAEIARGEREPAKLHIPAEFDVKAIRQSIKLSQDDFASAFGFTIHQIKDWEQCRSRPLGGNRAYLMLIRSNPHGVLEALRVIAESQDRDGQSEMAKAM